MHRLQISLTETQYEFLKSESFVTGKSMAAVLRDLLDDIIASRQHAILDDDPIWATIGVGEEIEGPTDVSRNVDKYLYGERETVVEGPMNLKKVAEEPDEYTTD